MENKILTEYNKSLLRKCQLVQLDILTEVDRICRKHNITYWLDGGTLLGAVRHKGFIPWDDDMDIAMPVDDYKRFAEIAPKEFPAHLFLQTEKTDPSIISVLPKVRNLNSFYVEFRDDFSAPYQKGLYIDITPFIGFPTKFQSLTKKVTRSLSVAYHILHSQHYYTFRAFAEFFYFSVKYPICRGLWSILRTIGGKGKYSSCITHTNGYGIIHLNKGIYPVKSITFEGREFYGPNDPDLYLTEVFGDYMTLPPVEKRKTHAAYMNPELIKGMTEEGVTE
ncbi:phosphorylcholine transferase LicD [Bacteroides sp. 51]|uniref:LicD family protein n=1 Tax=Bacteroides sp. 51 TaxID=2302938 RepID=UPI0013D3350F|nr:LicD family protein [Bacteroides sp. 51]NDV81633.1 LicD family protein [Bacteroides sp. 51]